MVEWGIATSALSRRQLLHRAGGIALAVGTGSGLGWLSGCGDDGGDPDWEELARRIEGGVVRPTDPDYVAVARPLNRRYEAIRPAGVAVCASARDVRESLMWARESELPIAVRSGGHNYAAYCAGPGLVINLGQMRRVEVIEAAGTLRVEPGARNTDVYRGLQPHGVAISAGRCPTVAIGGLVLGGGIGFSSRKLGLTCDSLIEAEVVTADGEQLRVNADRDPDLFWALRGGGGGNFALSTSFHFATKPVGDVTLYDITWDWDDAADVFEAFQRVIAGAPDEFSARLGAGRAGKPASGEASPPSVSALGQYFGPERELLELLDPALTVARPTASLIEPRTFWQAKNYLFHTTPRGFWATKSSYLDRPLSGDGVDALLRKIEELPGSRNRDGAGIAIFGSGGAINRVAADATAFVHRDAFALMASEVSWSAADPEPTVQANLGWLDAFAEAMSPHVSGAAYQNFIDRSQPDWQQAYYGENLARLTEVKRAYDPDDVFSFEQSIPLG